MKQLRQRYQNVCRMKQNTVNAFNTEAFIRKKSAGVPSFWRLFAYLETDVTDGCHIMCSTGSGRMVYQPAAGGWRMRQTYLTGTADGGNFSSGLWRSGYRDLQNSHWRLLCRTSWIMCWCFMLLPVYRLQNLLLQDRNSRSRCSRYWRNFQNRQNQVEMAKCNASSEEVAASAESEDVSGHFGKMVSMPGRKRRA